MAEITQITYSVRELTELLLTARGITEGDWVLGFNFSLTALNASVNNQPSCPSALLQIMHLSLQRTDAPTDISVDAKQIGFPRELELAA